MDVSYFGKIIRIIGKARKEIITGRVYLCLFGFCIIVYLLEVNEGITTDG